MTNEELYLDWWTNYLTVDKFANDYGFTKEHAENVIDLGRDDFNRGKL